MRPQIPAADRAHVEIIRIQVTIALEQVTDQFLIVACRLTVQAVAFHRLGQEFGMTRKSMAPTLPDDC